MSVCAIVCINCMFQFILHHISCNNDKSNTLLNLKQILISIHIKRFTKHWVQIQAVRHVSKPLQGMLYQINWVITQEKHWCLFGTTIEVRRLSIAFVIQSHFCFKINWLLVTMLCVSLIIYRMIAASSLITLASRQEDYVSSAQLSFQSLRRPFRIARHCGMNHST